MKSGDLVVVKRAEVDLWVMSPRGPTWEPSGVLRENNTAMVLSVCPITPGFADCADRVFVMTNQGDIGWTWAFSLKRVEL